MNYLNQFLTLCLFVALYIGMATPTQVEARVPTCTEEACDANGCDGVEDQICIMVWCGEVEGWVRCYQSFT